MKKLIYISLSLFLLNYIAVGQQGNFPAEYMYIQTNSATYITGETLLYKVYCFENSKTNLTQISKTAYVEILNNQGERLVRNKIELVNGIGNAEIFIGTNFNTGKYKLVGYTSWMQNNDTNKYFEKELTIINPFKPFQNNEESSANEPHYIKQTDYKSTNSIALTLDKNMFSTREKITLKIDKNGLKNGLGSFTLAVRKMDSLHFSSKPYSFEVPIEKVNSIKLLPELRGELLSGSISNENKNISVKDISVGLSLTGKNFDFKIYKTDKNGTFNFILDKNISNNEAYIQVIDANPENFKITLDEPVSSMVDYSDLKSSLYINPDFINQIEERLVACQVLNSYAVFNTSIKDSVYAPFYYPLHTDYILDEYKRFPTFKETISEVVSGVYYRYKKKRYILNVNNFDSFSDSYGEPLVLVDGLLIQNANELFQFNPKQIYKISVINTPYVYGSKIFSGIISVITFENNFITTSKEVVPITLERYITSLESLKPTYETNILDRIPDYRYQLLWNPNLVLSESISSIAFYASDVKGRFEITLEGFNEKGEHVVIQEYFSVK